MRFPYKRIPPSTHLGVILSKGFLPKPLAMSVLKRDVQNDAEVKRETAHIGVFLIQGFLLLLIEIVNGLGNMKSNLLG